MSNYLSSEKRACVVAALCEGVGVRATGRIVGVDRETVAKIGREVGEGYARLHDLLFVNLMPKRLELDEAWIYVHTKEARVRANDPDEYGDQYSFIALDSDTKAILAYHSGRRTAANTRGFALDLASRVVTKPQITTDGFRGYIAAIEAAFGPNADYAMCIKEYVAACSVEASRRYVAAEVEKVEKIVVSGDPDEAAISTAYVERQNLTLRMLTKRFSRLSNGFSKNLRNHRAAMDLYVGYYNLCWAHEALSDPDVPGKVTPAMAQGVASERWEVERFTRECAALAFLRAPCRVGDPLHEHEVRDRFRKRKV